MTKTSILKNISILAIGISYFLWAWSERYDFQLIQLGEMNRSQFLLDKKTGRVWQHVCDGEVDKIGGCDGIMVWSEMYISDWTPPDSRPALIYNYLLERREEIKSAKAKPKE